MSFAKELRDCAAGIPFGHRVGAAWPSAPSIPAKKRTFLPECLKLTRSQCYDKPKLRRTMRLMIRRQYMEFP